MNESSADPTPTTSRWQPFSPSNYRLTVAAVSAWLGLAVFAGTPSGPFWLLAPGVLAITLARAPLGRSTAESVRTRIRFPVIALLIAIVVGTAVGSCSVRKDAGFVWGAMPAADAAGERVSHPGVYTHDFMGPADRGSWYADGGPYVPLATDSPDQAAERLRSYLDDRFDLVVDPARVRAVFDAHPPNWDASDGDHPYVEAILATEREFEAAAGSVLTRRLGLRLLLALLLGSFAVRLQFKDVRLLLWVTLGVAAVGSAWVLIAQLGGTNVEYAVWQWLAPADRLHAGAPWLWNAALLAATAGLLVWSYRVAEREVRALPARAA